MKKFIICFLIAILLVIGICFFKYKTEAIECWWGVMYPSLSYIAFEDEDTSVAKISSSDKDYLYIPDTKIKTKIFIIEWLKDKISF